MEQLAIVVACTERKSLAADPDMHLRALSGIRGTTHRLAEWQSRLTASSTRVTLRDLYQGESWSQVTALETKAREAGFEPDLFVASAGLGMRHVDERAPSYAATFSTGHPDSVVGDIAARRDWWDGLNARSNVINVLEVGDGPLLFVLSDRYARVLEPTIRRLAPNREVLVVGGAGEIGGIVRLPADRQLRSILGGTMTGLNMRMAVEWLSRLGGRRLTSAEARSDWTAWSVDVRRPEVYGRAAAEDGQVLAHIASMRESDPGISKTRALRLLRDQGIACEQLRFGRLFDTTGAFA